jgi:transcription-repair coupling factor (superfamily II helicase)
LKLTDLVKEFHKHPGLKELNTCLRNNGTGFIQVNGIGGSAFSLVIINLFRQSENSLMVIAPEKEEAAYLFNDLEQIASDENLFFFPSSFRRDFTPPIDFKKSEGNIILRNRVMDAINEQKKLLIVSYPEALIEKEANIREHQAAVFNIHKGEKISTQFLSEFLYESGFKRTDFVYGPGEFSIRGSIIDVFSFSDENPYRIDLFGDEVESLRTFDIMTQLSVKVLEKIIIHPDVNQLTSSEKKTSFFEILPTNFVLWIKNVNYFIERNKLLFEQICKKLNEENQTENQITPESFDGFNDTKKQLNKYKCFLTGSTTTFETMRQIQFHISKQPDFNKNFNFLAETIHNWQAETFTNYILSGNPNQLERLKSILGSNEVQKKADFVPILGILHEGFVDKDLAISCYTDHQIFERYHRVKLINDKFSEDKSALSLKEITNLQTGDYVVHSDYGIGRFGGIISIENNGKKQETIRILYKNNDAVFVSIHSLHKVSKYRAAAGIPPAIHKLGSGVWQKLKDKTKSKVKDIAKELIALYAKRKDEEGFRFSPDTYLQEALEASFIYEDTPDQAKATRDTKMDMESDLPMDRLICGDVGFGKTEVAIRAAFKAVTDGKQVAVLVPTTILALQHNQTFRKRLKEFPCRIEYISRFKSRAQQSIIISDLMQGKIDILIGTHRIVGNDVKFKDLGLLIVDEEQKFGVSIKEKLKQLKTNVDTLTLTATPIPRTLQFSLMGARDLSVINTPPPDRYPIHTELHTFNEEIIRSAIYREVERSGQVFIIHNRVQNIYELQHLINKICPDVKTVVGHGQMKGDELEKIMFDFINQEYDILIATTIIESGLDIPNANTIIINNAQNFGLSDLHQLRGRVGRSNKKAYCYLLAPPVSVLSPESRKRLNAIEEFSELGSGFNIALQDLDIRGAGNLLGAEQSGFIADIGFETYQQILNEAMFELREEMQSAFPDEALKETSKTGSTFASDCQIDTDLELLFPETFIENTAERIKLYRELDNIKDEKLLEKFENDLFDRFGKVPAQSIELINTIRLRWKAIQLGFAKIILKNQKLICHFAATESSLYYNSGIFSGILAYVSKNPKICHLKEQNKKLALYIEPIKSVKEAIELLKKMAILSEMA